MQDRPRHLAALRHKLAQFPIVALLGPRQVGKTTLARMLVAGWDEPTAFFDLEDPVDQRRLEDPGLALRALRGLVVLDEIQRMPALFDLLRVLVDRPDRPARFLVLGSAAPHIVKGVSETLAGRVAFHDLPGLDLDEVEDLDARWLRGGFPRAYLAPDDAASAEWREQFVRTFLERDLPGAGLAAPAPTMRRFWTMLAHWHGKLWNASELSAAFAVSDKTVRRYLDYLEATYVVHTLQPWFENVAKRQVKRPKVYLADSGLLHALLGLVSDEQLRGHPIVGASWEGFAISQILARLSVRWSEAYFWATHGGAELDLLVFRGGRRVGFEVKLAEAPTLTRSIQIAVDELGLDEVVVVHAGAKAWQMADRVRALPLRDVWTTTV